VSGVRASSVFPRSSAYTASACYPYHCMAPRPGPSYKLIGKDWILSMYVANDASCTSVGMTRYPTMTFLHRTSLFEVSYIIRKRRLGLFGHVARLRSDVPANLILRICTKTRDCERPSPEWRCTCGQPFTTWVRQICRDTGVSATEALLLAEDRLFW